MTIGQDLDRVKQIIKNFNPFESNFIAKAHDIWDDDFLDVPVLHTQASEAIFDALQRVNADPSKGKVTGIVLLAEKGSGKSHIMGRVAHRIRQEGSAFFIYIGEYGNLNSVKLHFLQAIASSLKKIGSKGVSQWQELATFLINSVATKTYSPSHLVDQFPKALAKAPKPLEQFNKLASKILHKYDSRIDNPYIIKAILWTLSKAHAPFAINWLAGKELSETQARLMDMPAAYKEAQETEAFSKICQILTLVSDYTTPVICFDELDGTEYADVEDSAIGGLARAQVVCNLVKDIYNNLSRGVLVTALFPETWKLQLKQLSNNGGSIFEGIVDRVGEREIRLQHLKSDDAVILVASYLENFYSAHNVSPPHPVYPFDEKVLRERGDGATVRELLHWCAKNFNAVEIDPIKQLEKLYHIIDKGLGDYEENNELIAKALAFGLERLQGQTVENITILDLDRDVKPKYKHKGYVNFRILGEEAGKAVKIGVSVLQNSHGKTVGAAIGYLTQYQDLDLTRGCLVRSKKISEKWQVAQQNCNKLLNELGGEWVSFKDEEVRPLLILNALFKEFDRELIPEEAFWEFVEKEHPLNRNTLLCEILSDPSGQVPMTVRDEDNEFEKLLSVEAEQTAIEITPMTPEDLDDFFSVDS